MAIRLLDGLNMVCHNSLAQTIRKYCIAVKLKEIMKKDPRCLTKAKWYLTRENTGNVRIKEIANEIEGRSVFSLKDGQSVLSNMVKISPLFLEFGQSGEP
jgi:hypothetical protein